MDSEFEAALLHLIDEFLAGGESFDEFVEFKNAFVELYAATDPESARLKRGLPDSPISERMNSRLGQELQGRFHDRLPRERREFFRTLAERLWYVARDEPDARAKGYGYRRLADHREAIKQLRIQYQETFGH